MSTDLENKPTDKNNAVLKTAGNKNTIIAICIGVVILLGVILGALSFVPSTTIVEGVSVGDLKLSGMTQTEAAAAIAEHDFDGSNNQLSIKSGSNTRVIGYDEIDLTVDAEAIAQNAFNICHSENTLANMAQAVTLKFSKKQLPVTYKADTLKLDTILAEFGDSIHGKLVQHDIKVSDMSDKVIITPGTTGCSTNFETARNEILASVSQLEFDNIPVTLDKENPKELDAKALAESIRQEPKDAEYSVADNKAMVVPHVVGIELDMNDAVEKLSSISEGGEPVEINIIKSMPMLTQADLEAKLFNTTLSTFTTTYNQSAVNRSKNVAIAANRINGYILAPGAEFSYNEVVGKRTVANGFLNAPVYENGKSVDGIGGGVCQVSTTLYCAVLYGDLEIVSRQNHSMPVTYVPLGQDATVVDGAIDFKFKNNTNYPIKITSTASHGKLTVSIMGTQRDTNRTVKLEHVKLSEVPPTVKEIQDPAIATGTRVVTSKGKTGYVIQSTKYVYENGALVETKSLGKSTYKMVPEEVSVGTGPAAVDTAAQPAVNVPLIQTPSVEVQPQATPAPAVAEPIQAAEPVEAATEVPASTGSEIVVIE